MSNDEPVDGRCNAKTRDGGYCANYPKGDSDRCRMHGADGGPPEDNQNAVSVEAWSKSFVSDFLRDDEIERVKRGVDALGEPETAKELGRQVAMICLEQFRRTGDERFLRRYESICDTFGIAPADELEVSGEVSTEDITIDFNNVDT